MAGENNVYAAPRSVAIEECEFYHVIDLPGVGQVEGQWDLRGHVDEYLGHVDFQGKRVLEIGPASGFLTIEMERRGADVVAVEVPDNPGWDFVPYPADVLNPIRMARAEHMRRIKNSFWFVHRAYNAKAKLYYGDVYSLPDALGMFDIAVMAAVLLHTRSPLAIIAECAKRAEILVITDLLHADIEGTPVCRLQPTYQNKSLDTWWQFSSELFAQFSAVLGYDRCVITKHKQAGRRGSMQFFTMVASKKKLQSGT